MSRYVGKRDKRSCGPNIWTPRDRRVNEEEYLFVLETRSNRCRSDVAYSAKGDSPMAGLDLASRRRMYRQRCAAGWAGSGSEGLRSRAGACECVLVFEREDSSVAKSPGAELTY